MKPGARRTKSPRGGSSASPAWQPGRTAPLLSVWEREILESLATGQRYKEIADTLGLSFHTIRAHVLHSSNKLHVRSRNQALRTLGR